MSEYKRLTDKKVKGTTERYIRVDKDYILSAYDIITEEKYDFGEMLLNRLAELEDKIENGTLRDFPCNIGDEVFWAWDLDKQYSQVMRGVVIGLSISHKNTVWFSVKYDDGLSFDHTIEDWGKSVFPTKAEAEKKLKELNKEL